MPGCSELPRHLGLHQEPLLLPLALRAQPLQGDLPADLAVLGQPDLADAARAWNRRRT